MKVDIINKTKFPVKKREIEKKASKAAGFFKHITEISIVFVNKREIKKLNKIYRNKDSVTDVLSFSYSEDGKTAGEIIICYEVARSDAYQLGMRIYDMIDVLVVHGIVHIAGYDHKTVKQQKEMEELEKKIHILINK